MKSPYEQLALPLLGGVVQAQRLVVPPEVVMGLKSYRHACRLAWKLRHPRITQRTLAEPLPVAVPERSMAEKLS